MAALHHWIPQFILRGFTDPHPPAHLLARPKFEPFLWAYDFETRCWKEQGTKRTASIRGFNSLPDRAGKEAETLEQAFSETEGIVAGILRNKIEPQEPIDGEEREWLALFAALAIARVPSFRRNLDDEIREEVQNFERTILDDPAERERFNRRYERDTGQPGVTEEQLHVVRRLLSRVRPEQAFYLHRMTEYMGATRGQLEAMSWRFLHSSGDDYFVLPDRALALIIDRSAGSPASLTHPGTALTMPLTRHICLHMNWRPDPLLHYSVGRRTVVTLNRHAIDSCDRELFAPKRRFPGSDYLTLTAFERSRRRSEDGPSSR